MDKLKQAQNIIADDSFKYGGNSLDIIEIVNAIKSGYRLIDLNSFDTESATTCFTAIQQLKGE